MPVIQKTNDIGVKAVAYVAAKGQEKEVKKTIETLRVDLEQYLKDKGVKNDKGHSLVVVSHAGINVELKHESRTGVSQNGDALITLKRLLKKKGISAAKVIETVEVIRQDVLEVMVNDGQITDSELATMFTKTSSVAFKVTKI